MSYIELKPQLGQFSENYTLVVRPTSTMLCAPDGTVMGPAIPYRVRHLTVYASGPLSVKYQIIADTVRIICEAEVALKDIPKYSKYSISEIVTLTLDPKTITHSVEINDLHLIDELHCTSQNRPMVNSPNIIVHVTNITEIHDDIVYYAIPLSAIIGDYICFSAAKLYLEAYSSTDFNNLANLARLFPAILQINIKWFGEGQIVWDCGVMKLEHPHITNVIIERCMLVGIQYLYCDIPRLTNLQLITLPRI